MDRLTLCLAILCGILFAVVAYLALTVAQLREEAGCMTPMATRSVECS